MHRSVQSAFILHSSARTNMLYQLLGFTTTCHLEHMLTNHVLLYTLHSEHDKPSIVMKMFILFYFLLIYRRIIFYRLLVVCDTTDTINYWTPLHASRANHVSACGLTHPQLFMRLLASAGCLPTCIYFTLTYSYREFINNCLQNS